MIELKKRIENGFFLNYLLIHNMVLILFLLPNLINNIGIQICATTTINGTTSNGSN